MAFINYILAVLGLIILSVTIGGGSYYPQYRKDKQDPPIEGVIYRTIGTLLFLILSTITWWHSWISFSKWIGFIGLLGLGFLYWKGYRLPNSNTNS